MTRFRRGFVWLVVGLLVFTLVATLLVDGAGRSDGAGDPFTSEASYSRRKPSNSRRRASSSARIEIARSCVTQSTPSVSSINSR
jgi:hypothetical protein